MSRFDSRLLADYIQFGRSVRIFSLSVFLLVFLIMWKLFFDQGKIIGEEIREGVVVKSTPTSYLVDIGEGKTILLPGKGALNTGAKVRVLEQTFEKGSPQYTLPPDAEVFP